MNFIMRRFIRRTVGIVEIINKQQYQTLSRNSSFPVNLESTIIDEKAITQLVQRNVIPLTDVLPKAIILDRPLLNILPKYDRNILEKIDIQPSKEIVDPSSSVEKKAHRMLIIKRRQMNRHKHKKHERKYKFQKLRKFREKTVRKENVFRNEIADKLKELQKFDPEEYVRSKLERSRMVVLPNRIHGTRMPPAVIVEHLEKSKMRKQIKLDRLERRKKFIEERGSIYIEEAKKLGKS